MVEKINNTAHEKGQGVIRVDSATNYHAVFHVNENGELSLDPWCENYTWLNYMEAVNQLFILTFESIEPNPRLPLLLWELASCLHGHHTELRAHREELVVPNCPHAVVYTSSEV